MYYNRGHHIEQTLVGEGCVVLTADKVLHDGNVVSCSNEFGTTTTRMPVSCTMSINFLDASVKAGSGRPLL